VPDQVVVSRPYPDSNVGSNLSSLAGAAWLARATGRRLVVDWRGLRQVGDRSLNYFSEFFATPPALLGVRTSYAPVEGLDYEQGALDARWPSPGEAREIGVRGGDDAAVLVLQPYHGLDRLHPGPEAERFRILRAFYRSIGPSRSIAAAVDQWSASHLDGAFVVGVNVRTGNGRYFGKGERYASRVDISIFGDRRRFLRRVERACRRCAARLPKPLQDSFVVFYATDSAEMSESLAALPHSVTRRRVFPPPGAGDLYRFEGRDYTDRDSIEDTLADMFLLARCDALVYNSSLFNQYARVVNGCFSGNQIHLESLFARARARRLLARVRRPRA
jgi:hypothetical protein